MLSKGDGRCGHWVLGRGQSVRNGQARGRGWTTGGVARQPALPEEGEGGGWRAMSKRGARKFVGATDVA